jgi:hypothetical protein
MLGQTIEEFRAAPLLPVPQVSFVPQCLSATGSALASRGNGDGTFGVVGGSYGNTDVPGSPYNRIVAGIPVTDLNNDGIPEYAIVEVGASYVDAAGNFVWPLSLAAVSSNPDLTFQPPAFDRSVGSLGVPLPSIAAVMSMATVYPKSSFDVRGATDQSGEFQEFRPCGHQGLAAGRHEGRHFPGPWRPHLLSLGHRPQRRRQGNFVGAVPGMGRLFLIDVDGGEGAPHSFTFRLQ